MAITKMMVGNKWSSNQDPLQAIIIADGFDDKFKPITYTKPMALLPLVNRPMINYTFDMLINSGVEQIIIVICSNAEKVRKYVMENSSVLDLKVTVQFITVGKTECLTLGDALREIDRDHRALLQGEFIVLYGFVISKSSLKNLLARHYNRKRGNDDIIMTAVFNTYPKNLRNRIFDDDLFMLTDNTSRKILHFQNQSEKSYNFPLDILNTHSNVDIHFNLGYSGIYFVDIRALQLFSDNFDFQTMDDFIRNVIGDELLAKSICYDVISEGYFGTIVNLKSYHLISFDILRRWTYPNVPDLFDYSLHPNNIYLGKNVDIHRTAQINSLVVVGNNSTIREAVLLDRTVIGSNCIVGPRTIITNSYIWDNVRIGEGCVISNSIICDNCTVHSGCELKTGCILAFNVVVGPNVEIPKSTVIHLPSAKDGTKLKHTSFTDLGQLGEGSIYIVHEYDRGTYQWANISSTRAVAATQESDASETESVGARVTELDNIHEFYFEVRDSMESGMTDNVPAETILTEINLSKHAHNIAVEDVNKTITDVLSEWLFPSVFDNKDQNMNQIHDRFKSSAPFCRYYFSKQSQLLAYLNRIEDFIWSNEKLVPFYFKVIFEMFLNEIVDETVLTIWRDCSSDGTSKSHELLSTRSRYINMFLEKLKKSRCESSSEEEESESEE